MEERIIKDINKLLTQLFQKMKEAGYEWDAEKKELKKIEQKPAWSKEDESILQGIWDEILANKHDAKECEWKTYDKFLNWLESLRPQNTWKPSDEQVDYLNQVIEFCANGSKHKFYMKQLYNDLKKLKG